VAKNSSSGGAPVTVVVADDHPLYREGLIGAIQARQDLELLGEASDGDDALEIIRRGLPDVALLDVKMDVDGTSVLRRLQGSGGPTRVVFLSAYLDSALIYSALEAGASGFLSKRADRSTICDAVVAAARGEIVLSPEIQTALGREIRANHRRERPALTSREREVLVLAAEGLSAPDIGERLFLSTSTVKTHLAHLYEKLGVSDRTAAVAEAFRQGLVE
jgi:two-component system, NarL family, nitrate/nitrite response regulator NarL